MRYQETDAQRVTEDVVDWDALRPFEDFENRDLVEFLIKVLTPVQTTVIRSHYWPPGASYAEIGLRLGCSRANVKKIHDKAVERMRRAYWREMRIAGDPIYHHADSQEHNQVVADSSASHAMDEQAERTRPTGLARHPRPQVGLRSTDEHRVESVRTVEVPGALSNSGPSRAEPLLPPCVSTTDVERVNQKVGKDGRTSTDTKRKYALLHKIYSLARRSLSSVGDGSFVVEMPSRTLKTYDRKYWELMPYLIADGSLTLVRKHSTRNHKCRAYKVTRPKDWLTGLSESQ